MKSEYSIYLDGLSAYGMHDARRYAGIAMVSILAGEKKLPEIPRDLALSFGMAIRIYWEVERIQERRAAKKSRKAVAR